MKRRWVIALAVGAVVSGSCGAGPLEDAGTEPGGDSAESTTTAAPAATTFPPEEIGCPNFLADYEDRADRRSYEQNRLTRDARRLSDYLAAHEDVFGGLRIAHNPSRLEIGFTAEIDEHCYVLRELAKRPNGIDVIRVDHSISDKWAAAEVAAQAGALTIRPGWGPVRVHLPAFAEEIAADLDAAYGDMFAIEVGAWPYPPPQDVPVGGPCSPVVESEDLPPLHVTLTPPSEPFNYLIDGKTTNYYGAPVGEVTLVVENRGTRTGTLSWGQQTTWLYADGDPQPVAIYTGLVEHWGKTGQLAPGDAVEMTAYIGLTPCSLEDGYMLSSGTYHLRGPIEFKWNDESYVMLTDPVPVVVEETPPVSLPPQEVQSPG